MNTMINEGLTELTSWALSNVLELNTKLCKGTMNAAKSRELYPEFSVLACKLTD